MNTTISPLRKSVRKIRKTLTRIRYSRTRDFAWKVRQRMRYDRNPLLVTVQDKYQVKSYAKDHGVQTPKLLFVTANPDEIPFQQLPKNCFVKINNGCRWNIARIDSIYYLYGDGRTLTTPSGQFKPNSAQPLTEDEIRTICGKWLRERPALPNQWAYHQIPPKIFGEEFLIAQRNTELFDYRLYTFKGIVRAINVGSPSYRARKLNIFFDADWQEITLTKYSEQLPNPRPTRPDCLEELLLAAKRLGSDLDFIRIDMFDTAKGPVLGEMTVYPDGGNPNSPTKCSTFNHWLGNQWAMSSQNNYQDSA